MSYVAYVPWDNNFRITQQMIDWAMYIAQAI